MGMTLGTIRADRFYVTIRFLYEQFFANTFQN
jgi:hypothetical protein